MAKAEYVNPAHGEGRLPKDQHSTAGAGGLHVSLDRRLVPGLGTVADASPQPGSARAARQPIVSVGDPLIGQTDAASRDAGQSADTLRPGEPEAIKAKAGAVGDGKKDVNVATRAQELHLDNADNAATADGGGPGKGKSLTENAEGDDRPRNWEEATSFMRVHDGGQTDIPHDEQAEVARELNAYVEKKKATLRKTNPAALEEDDERIFGRTHAEL